MTTIVVFAIGVIATAVVAVAIADGAALSAGLVGAAVAHAVGVAR